MAVYIYARQSSGSSEQSVSIDQQTENCKQLAEKNGLKITKIFADYNCSGRLFPLQLKSLAEMDLVYQQFLKETKKVGQWRDELNNLLDELKKGDTILIDDKTRLCRSLNGSYLENALIQILKSKKIKLLSNKEGEIDFESFTDQLVFSLQSSINSNQLEIQRKKSKDSIKRLMDSGEFKQSLGMALGYRFTGRKKEVEIDPVKAEIVRFIFKNYIEGKSINSIIKSIDAKFGMKTCTRSIRKVIERPLYCGYMYDTNGNLVISKQTENKKIIDYNTWKTAKEILDSRKTNRTRIKYHQIHLQACVSVANVVPQ